MYSLPYNVLHIDLARAIFLPIDSSQVEATSYDRYGIDESASRLPTAEFPSHSVPVSPLSECSPDVERRRLRKWEYMLQNWSQYYAPFSGRITAEPREFAKLRRRTLRGIPDGVRQAAWSRLLRSDNLVCRNETSNARTSGAVATASPDSSTFGRFLRMPIPFDEQGVIGRDIRRTFQGFALLSSREGMLVMARLLIALAASDPRVGYMQSFTFIAAALLNYMPEVDAFWAFKALMARNDFYLCYTQGLPGVQMRCWALEQLLCQRVPRWQRVIDGSDGALVADSTSLWATKFIMTLFFRDIPFPLAVRIFDRFLVDGESVIYRVLIAFIERELAGPLCRTPAEYDAAISAGRLPALDSPVLAQASHNYIIIQRILTISERITLDTAQDVLDRCEAGPALHESEVLELYRQWRETVGRQSVRQSADQQRQRLVGVERYQEDAESLACSSRLAQMLSGDIQFDSRDKLTGPINEEIARVLAGVCGTGGLVAPGKAEDSAEHLHIAYSRGILQSRAVSDTTDNSLAPDQVVSPESSSEAPDDEPPTPPPPLSWGVCDTCN